PIGIRIYYEVRVQSLADRFRVVAQDNQNRIAKFRKHAHKPPRKRLASIFKQRFRTAHSAGRPGGQNNSRDHFGSALRLSCAKMDFDTDRQSASGARRTAIISATTEIAISSGDSAPISRPIGAKIFSNNERGKPSFSSSRITEIVLRLLPIIAMY